MLPGTVCIFEARLEMSTGIKKAIVYVAHAVCVVSVFFGVQAGCVVHIDLLMHSVDRIEIEEELASSRSHRYVG